MAPPGEGRPVRFLLLLLFGDCGFTGCGRPARLAPAAFGNSVASLSDGQLCTFGSCCSSVTVASSSAGRWGSSVPAALWRLRGFSTTSTTTCSCSCCSSATLWSSLSVGRPSTLAPAALRRPCGLHQARGSQLSGFWLLFGTPWLHRLGCCASSSCCSSVTSWLQPAPGLLRTPDFLQRSQLSPAGVECSVHSCLDCR